MDVKELYNLDSEEEDNGANLIDLCSDDEAPSPSKPSHASRADAISLGSSSADDAEMDHEPEERTSRKHASADRAMPELDVSSVTDRSDYGERPDDVSGEDDISISLAPAVDMMEADIEHSLLVSADYSGDASFPPAMPSRKVSVMVSY